MVEARESDKVLTQRLPLSTSRSDHPSTPATIHRPHHHHNYPRLTEQNAVRFALTQLRNTSECEGSRSLTARRSFMNRVNRVTHYQRLFQKDDGLRMWLKVRLTRITCWDRQPAIVADCFIEPEIQGAPYALLYLPRAWVLRIVLRDVQAARGRIPPEQVLEVWIEGKKC